MQEATRYKTRSDAKSDNSLTKPIKSYFGIIPLSGAALTSGAAYWTGLAVEFFSETISSVPYIIQQPEYQSIPQTIYTAFEQGKEQGANWALIGGLIGLVLTNKFKNAIVSFIKR